MWAALIIVVCKSVAKIATSTFGECASTTTTNKSYFIKLVDRAME
jgi:hypothetical protein